MKLLDMTRKYGTATYEYPFAPYKVSEYFRGKPVYDYDKCIGCTACAVACPSNAINVKMNSEKTKLVWEFDCARCIFCGRCDEVCPTNAVMQSQQYEVAVKFNKDALKIRAELELEVCRICAKKFTTKRLISFNMERLLNCGWEQNTFKEKTEYMHTCPDCKRDIAVERSSKYFAGGKK